MGISIKKKPSATISKEVKSSGNVISEEQHQEEPSVPVSQGKAVSNTPWCTVGVEASYTHNLGNYQSARIGVSITIPCEHSEIDIVFEYAKVWTDKRMQTLIAELTEGGE